MRGVGVVHQRRHHSEQDIIALYSHIGDGVVTTGINRIADWCGITRDSVRRWSEFFGRIPDKWYETVQQCSIEYTGVRFDIDFMETGAMSRSCLRCSRKFMSAGIGNRICDHCKGSEEWQQLINSPE